MIDQIIKFDKVKKYVSEKSNELISYQAQINGKWYNVPLDEGNKHYIEIHRQVDAGELTIEEAD